MPDEIIVPLPGGILRSGWCDHDDPERLDCGDYLAVDTATGDQLFYAEAADLAAVGAVALRRQFRRLVHSLQQVAATRLPPAGAPSATALGSVPVALLDVRAIDGHDNTSGIGVVVLPLDAATAARLRYMTDLAKDCCHRHDLAQSIRFKLGDLAPQAYSGGLVRAIEDVEEQEVRLGLGLECCLGDQLCVEGFQVYRSLPVNLVDFEECRFGEAVFWEVTASPATVEFSLSSNSRAALLTTGELEMGALAQVIGD